MAKKKTNIRETLINEYMQYVLTHNEKPKSVFKFAEDCKIKESKFYDYFGSFEAIDAIIFVDLFNDTIRLLEQNDDFKNGTAKHKLLSFYFTYFEMLTANRSFVTYLLKQHENKLKTLQTLNAFKSVYTAFVKSLNIKTLDMKIEQASQFMEKGIGSASFAQFLFILKYWLNDTSPRFEKTDILIEKSMHAGFELLNTQPLETFIDLGKFLWKEKMMKN